MPSKLKELIRFDWAMKKLLRDKANFDILEGFLSELLHENIKINQILESESNKDDDSDKYNRVDILVENTKRELMIIEVQNSKEYDYFHRILYGTSKAIAEHIDGGEPYAAVKKVISITIAYFDLGEGKDYMYHGTTIFKGMYESDLLDLPVHQQGLHRKKGISGIFPEYYIIKIGKFDNNIKNKLDEWVFFLKNGKIDESFTAKGLPEANEKLDELRLSQSDRYAYRRYVRRLHDIASEEYNKMVDIAFMADAEELIKKMKEEAEQKGKEEKETEDIIAFYEIGVSIENIAKALKITEEKVREIIEQHNNKTKSEK